MAENDSNSATWSDQGEQAFCDAVTDVTDKVRETASAGARAVKNWPEESIRRGNCTRCFFRAKRAHP